MRNLIFIGLFLLTPFANAKVKRPHCFVVTASESDPTTYTNQIGEIVIDKSGIENMKYGVIALDRNSLIQLTHDDIAKRADENNFKDIDGRLLVAVQSMEKDHVGISLSKIDASKSYKDMPPGVFTQAFIGNKWQRAVQLWSFENLVSIECMWN